MRKVLFVDDEPNVLSGLRRMLRPMRDEWDMSFAEGATAALKMLAENEFHVVVTDMRMPNMDGADLLRKVHKLDPGITRIVLSGQTDQESALRSSGTAHQFLAKPCDADTLREAVLRACRLRDLLKNEKIQRVVAGLDALPSLPEIYQELRTEMDSDDMSLERVGEIIAKDIALTAKLLQLVNSAFFGLPRHIENIGQATNFLGADTIRSLALSTAAFKCFQGDSSKLQLDALWNHSLAVGSAAHAIAIKESKDRVVADEAMQAGMLHDIGKLIIATGIPDAYEQVLEKMDCHGMTAHDAELEVLGCDHSQMGAYLIGLWGLPDSIVEAIAFHHAASEVPANEFSVALAVFAANRLCPSSPAATVDDPSEDLGELKWSGLSPEKCQEWLALAAT